MFFEGGGYKSRAGCHGGRTVLTYVVQPVKYLILYRINGQEAMSFYK